VRQIGEGLVIMAPEGDTTHSLEEIAAFIWNRIDGTRDLAGVLDTILEAYEVDRDTAEADLLEFCHKMVDAGLLVIPAE
jgi:hypothetical protein